jgi:N-carbamoylputrescine amidase
LFNPSATTAGKSQYLWQLEQPAQAVANGVFIGANNRVGLEKPWEFGQFYGSSYFADPRGKILVKGSEDKDGVVMADLDLDEIREVRDGWQFFRDLRPDMYGDLSRTISG